MNSINGPAIILGGNGLGKTTLIQAIIYGMTGGNESIEEPKGARWNHHFFTQRLNKNKISSASIQVELIFDKQALTIQRGLGNPNVQCFKLGAKKNGWIKNSTKAQTAFEKALFEFGGYKNKEDFSFVVHRLLFLSEDRRLLAWDADAQIRILMLLIQGQLSEDDFRERRGKLQNMDTDKRHIRVALGKINAQIINLEKVKKPKTKKRPSSSDHESENLANVQHLIKSLKKVSKNKLILEKDIRKLSEQLNSTSSEIETLRESIELKEASIFDSLMQNEEKESSLALNKLIEQGICPACGTLQEQLKHLANQHLQNHQCLICGSEELQIIDAELSTFGSQLSTKIRSQQTLINTLRPLKKQYDLLNSKEDDLQFEANKIWEEEAGVGLIERGLTTTEIPDSLDDLYKTKSNFERQEAKLENQIQKKQKHLENDFEEFGIEVHSRLERLREIYQTYATQFLGIKCELVKEKATGLVNFTIFIPKFYDIARETSSDCSEAQRFFLDIAFRLALVDLACEEVGGVSTFFCETPETALDISYIDNVVKMLQQFTDKDNSIVLTSNIQKEGIAEKLLEPIPKEKRSSLVINLLEIGQRSEVHNNALKKLRKIVNKIMN